MSGSYGVSLGALDEIVLDGINVALFFPYLFGDYMRFALASKESIHLSFEESFDRRATAWPLINRYYSAFFSAHALLRSQGAGMTWLDAGEVAHLERLGKLYVGPNFTMRRGGYSFSVNPGNGYNGEVRLVAMNYGSGSHDDFWRYFVDYIADFGAQLLRSGAPMAAQTVGRIAEFERIIKAPSGRGIWLSFMRNEINYQHKYGTWYPFKPSTSGSSQDRRILTQTNNAIDLTADASRHPLKAFNAITCCLAALNNDFAVLMKERMGTGANRFKAEWNRLQTRLDS